MFRRFITITALALPSLTGGVALAQTIDWHDRNAVAKAAASTHPALRRVEAEGRAARERVTQAAAFPNPMLMTGVDDLQVDLSHDEMMTMYMAGVSQTIPQRRRRQALRSAAELEVTRVELEGASIRAEIERDVLLAWYAVAASDSQLRALQDVASALDSLAGAVQARYESGSAIQADIIRAQLQRSEIDHQILTTTAARRTAAARLLALLGLPLTTEVPLLQLAHATEASAIRGLREIADSHPALAALRADVERLEQGIRLAKLLTRPDISVEASYGMRPQQKDTISVVGRVELPLRRKINADPRIREAIAARDAAFARIEELRRNLLASLGAAWEAHAEASKQIEFHEKTLVPQSKLAVESTRAAYEGGKTTLDAVLAAEATYLRLAIDYYEFLARHISAIADFEAIQRGARSGAIDGGAMVSPAMSAPVSAPAMAGMR